MNGTVLNPIISSQDFLKREALIIKKQKMKCQDQ